MEGFVEDSREKSWGTSNMDYWGKRKIRSNRRQKAEKLFQGQGNVTASEQYKEAEYQENEGDGAVIHERRKAVCVVTGH